MEKEKFEIEKEKKEQAEEIQRLELDPDEGVDIVIRKISSNPKEFLEKTGRRTRYLPAQIVLEKDRKVIEDFQKRVPNIELYFRGKKSEKPYSIWGVSWDHKTLRMPNRWKNNKDGLVFAHELGHILYHFKHPEEYIEERKLLEQEEEANFQLYTIEERGTIWYRTQAGEIPEERPGTEKDKERLNRKLKKIYQELIPTEARSERGAWAEGLNLIRKIKREKGIDLLKPLRGKKPEETRKNIETFVHEWSLSSYEERFRKKIKELGLDKKLKGSFTKKYKEKAKEISSKVSQEASKM